MCKGCKNNGPDSIAGVEISAYKEKDRQGQSFRLHLCTELQAKLLCALRKYSVVSTFGLSKDYKFLRMTLWLDIGLEAKYLQGFEKVLHRMYLYQ
ncbi:hypothetical protein NW762_012885 [Fusarium torreyae]|uniref:Uncharacterized protein n=1 Tax=Fusarium torreyae TaxID=1237075 RepID=A0A9W8RPC9_9HYPO|nr:hypothetical protein NW762_012885 [Fusarium torreyae]